MKKNRIAHGSTTDIIAHFVPAVIITALFQALAIEIYHHNPITTYKAVFFTWSISQAIGSFLLGLISDRHCRRKTLIATQVVGVLLLLSFIKYGYNNWLIVLLTGLIFSPSAIAKAALIDNFSSMSKVRIIGITFIALLLPWCIYGSLVSLKSFTVSIGIIIFLILNLVLSIFYFEDRRDRSPSKRRRDEHKVLFNKRRNAVKAAFIGSALVPAQIVFFLSDSFFEETAQNASFFTMLGLGVFIGACVSIIYSKLPHISVITVSYLFGFMFCLITLIAITNLHLPDAALPFFILLFSVAGGFYLPFVYDAILNSVSSSHRGATCGLIEGIISISGIIGLLIILIFNPHEKVILILMTVLFLIATILQKKGENHA